ncbi:DUF1003 domain-containing protein [Pseudanabaena catenata USMAC16]|uniref:DUF1003 domain-containing protein n=3 Tax=Pseudanabaena TaxID=1152 RepID=L8N2R7_9CYAN|nr:DUF1003 domain-containing protein [Pseudanabaena catenata]ELS33991.1 protein of unknown function DUF1003 [Pseudanabaena biceps PCC 7429]MDG3493777.1 DUF1003 domain-containing protein [Pseudanabaena catenata USMAC16]
MGKSPKSRPSQSSRGEMIADIVTATVGSWRFILIQSFLLGVWIVLNIISWIKHWDEYPFILLNLALSFQAAYATPFILMSQNRQSEVDRDKAKQDLDIDLKAEQEIESLHRKIDSLKDKEIAELTRMLNLQNQSIQRLEEMLGREINANHPLLSSPSPSSNEEVQHN